MKNAAVSRQFGVFLVTGGLAALANIGSRIGFSYVMPYAPAIVCAYIVGMTIAFLLIRTFVFREAANSLHHQAFWFVLVNLAAVLQTLIVSLVLYDFFFPHIGFHWHPETVAHAIGVGAPVITSFIGHKYLTFRSM